MGDMTMTTVALVALSLGVVAVHQRRLAVSLVAAQSVVLGVIALTMATDNSAGFVFAGMALLVKGVALPVLLIATRRRTLEPRLVSGATPTMLRLGIAASLALITTVATPSLGLNNPSIEHNVIALVTIGMATVILRRQALLQALGLLVVENGVYLLAIYVPGGMPFVIELGVLVDVMLVLTVIAAFTYKIYDEFGSGDTELLRGLRD